MVAHYPVIFAKSKMTCVQAPRRLPPQRRRPAVAGWHYPIDAIRSDNALAFRGEASNL